MINRDGVILTNNHVIAGAVKITVAFADNQTVTAKVIGKDPDDDLALLKVNPDGLHLVPLLLGNSDTVQVGDPTARDRQPVRAAALADDRRRLGAAAPDPGPERLRRSTT